MNKNTHANLTNLKLIFNAKIKTILTKTTLIWIEKGNQIKNKGETIIKKTLLTKIESWKRAITGNTKNNIETPTNKTQNAPTLHENDIKTKKRRKRRKRKKKQTEENIIQLDYKGYNLKTSTPIRGTSPKGKIKNKKKHQTSHACTHTLIKHTTRINVEENKNIENTIKYNKSTTIKNCMNKLKTIINIFCNLDNKNSITGKRTKVMSTNNRARTKIKATLNKSREQRLIKTINDVIQMDRDREDKDKELDEVSNDYLNDDEPKDDTREETTLAAVHDNKQQKRVMEEDQGLMLLGDDLITTQTPKNQRTNNAEDTQAPRAQYNRPNYFARTGSLQNKQTPILNNMNIGLTGSLFTTQIRPGPPPLNQLNPYQMQHLYNIYVQQWHKNNQTAQQQPPQLIS